MTTPSWQRVREIFEQAIGVTPVERPALVDAACAGDEALRREVDSLLAEHDAPDGGVDGTRAAVVGRLLDSLADRTSERLALAPGTTVDEKYLIEALVGRGGMGEVYRAKDLRLGRDVAVKVLPPALSRDSDRLRRFAHEARAAGMLNHPNVVAIYDTGTHDGAPYVVSELLDGESLRMRLSSGSLPPRKALEFAAQTARGLAAAHAKGIIHRDLKPDNIFITRDDRAKILDFGIAKLTQPSTGESPSAIGTEPGVIIGTNGYMSPEQVRGEPVDHRSDVFAFGAVLYEMLAGAPAFRGASSVDTLHAILHDDPPPLADRGGSVPRGVELVIRRCLEKSPDARFQSTDDLAFEVGTLADTSWPDSGRSTRRRAIGVWPRAVRRLAPVLVVLALAAALIGGFFTGKRFAATPAPTYERLTFRRGGVYDARFAPDGQTIVYDAAWAGNPVEIYSTRAEGSESRSLGLGDAMLAAVSSRGEIAVLLGRRFGKTQTPSGTLARVPLAGGAPRAVLEDVTHAEWSPDGSELAVVHQVEGHDRLEYPIGNVLYEGSALGTIGNPRISPRNDRIAFILWTRGEDIRGSVIVIDRAGTVTTRTSEWRAALGLAWSPGGEEVLFTAAESGFALDLHAVTLSGEQRTLLRTPGGMRIADIHSNGRVLLIDTGLGAETVGFAPGQTREHDLSWLDWSELSDLSIDGSTVLLNEKGVGGGPTSGVYLRKTDGSPAVRLGDGYALALSPDAKWVLALKTASPAEVVMLPTGPGQSVPFNTGSIVSVGSATWFPDGRRVLLEGSEAGRVVRGFVASTDGASPIPVTPEGVIATAVSPDGKYVLGYEPASSSYHRYPVDGGVPLAVSGLESGERPIQWSADGRSLFAFRPSDLPARVFRIEVETGRRELLRELTPPDPAGVDGIAWLRMTPDASRYAYGYIRVLGGLYLVDGLF